MALARGLGPNLGASRSCAQAGQGGVPRLGASSGWGHPRIAGNPGLGHPRGLREINHARSGGVGRRGAAMNARACPIRDVPVPLWMCEGPLSLFTRSRRSRPVRASTSSLIVRFRRGLRFLSNLPCFIIRVISDIIRRDTGKDSRTGIIDSTAASFTARFLLALLASFP